MLVSWVMNDFKKMFCVLRFRLKYHPDDSSKRKAEQKENVLRRLEIFQCLYDEGRIDELHIDYDYAAEIIRIMDTCELCVLIFFQAF